jgi:hypothetical protein
MFLAATAQARLLHSWADTQAVCPEFKQFAELISEKADEAQLEEAKGIQRSANRSYPFASPAARAPIRYLSRSPPGWSVFGQSQFLA